MNFVCTVRLTARPLSSSCSLDVPLCSSSSRSLDVPLCSSASHSLDVPLCSSASHSLDVPLCSSASRSLDVPLCSSASRSLDVPCVPVPPALSMSPVFQCLPLSRCPLYSRGKAVCPSHLLPTHVSSTKPPPIHSSSLCNKTLPRPSHRQRPPGSQGLHGTQSAVLFSPLLSERLKSKQYFWPLYVNPYFTPEPPYSLFHLYFSVSQQAHLVVEDTD